MVNGNLAPGEPVKLYDISVPIHGDMPVYAGDPRVGVRPAAQMSKGHPFNSLRLSLGSHTGTHVDAPYHFDQGGTTVDRLPLETFYGPAVVRDVGDTEAIDERVLEGLDVPSGTQRLLLKTRNSRLWEDAQFHQQFVSVTPQGARWLVERGLRLVGIDYLSIEAFGSLEYATHHTLLRAGVVIVEGLDLGRVPPGEYTLLCFPLRLAEGGGAPARAVLVEVNG